MNEYRDGQVLGWEGPSGFVAYPGEAVTLQSYEQWCAWMSAQHRPRAAMTLTPELLAELRKKAEACRLSSAKDVSFSEVAALYDAIPPSVVLALLDRIAELDAAIPRCGCGSTSSVRGDPECDACGKDCYYCTCPREEPKP